METRQVGWLRPFYAITGAKLLTVKTVFTLLAIDFAFVF